nr:MAG TPA: hypothetical protein [Caudoviricetes sp.]
MLASGLLDTAVLCGRECLERVEEQIPGASFVAKRRSGLDGL